LVQKKKEGAKVLQELCQKKEKGRGRGGKGPSILMNIEEGKGKKK